MEIPTVCNFCGSDVKFTTNDELYGKLYGEGKIYLCVNKQCRASVGVHGKSKTPLGILSNREMKILKKACHDMFDFLWKTKKLSRGEAYRRLSIALEIEQKDCHFGYFDTEMLIKALTILVDSNWWRKYK